MNPHSTCKLYIQYLYVNKLQVNPVIKVNFTGKSFSRKSIWYMKIKFRGKVE